MTAQPAHVRRAQSIKRRVVRRPYASGGEPVWWVIDTDGKTYPFGAAWETAVRAAIHRPMKAYLTARMAP